MALNPEHAGTSAQKQHESIATRIEELRLKVHQLHQMQRVDPVHVPQELLDRAAVLTSEISDFNSALQRDTSSSATASMQSQAMLPRTPNNFYLRWQQPPSEGELDLAQALLVKDICREVTSLDHPLIKHLERKRLGYNAVVDAVASESAQTGVRLFETKKKVTLAKSKHKSNIIELDQDSR